MKNDPRFKIPFRNSEKACHFLNLEFFVIVSTFLLHRPEERTNYLERLEKANEIEKGNLTSPFSKNPTRRSSLGLF